MMLDGALLATVAFTSWKYSNPELAAPAARLALAEVRPAAATAPATATTPTPARILLRSFIMIHSLPLTGTGRAQGTGGRPASTPSRQPRQITSQAPPGQRRRLCVTPPHGGRVGRQAANWAVVVSAIGLAELDACRSTWLGHE